MASVFVKFPKTGLGNMMLVWAKGVVFSKLNQLDYVTSSWWGFHWGALIRREKRNRLYWGYFIESSWFNICAVQIKKIVCKTIFDPPVTKRDVNKKDIFIFKSVITTQDLFGDIRDYKDVVKNELYNILSPKMHAQLLNYKSPIIGIHIRRGDFKLGNPITPLSFFINGIKLVREASGIILPVTIFTDASSDEIGDILLMPEVSLAEEKADILDILLLSKSKILFLSKSSSFSYWGAYLSDAIVIRPENDWQQKIKNNNSEYQELFWAESNVQLTNSLIFTIKKYFKHVS